MELEVARDLAFELMKQHGLEYRYRFEFDNAKRRFGHCSYQPRFITLSKHLVLLNDYETVKNVILHEIAHALVDSGKGHNWVWREKASEIGCKFIGRFCDNDVITVPKNVVAKCAQCGNEVRKYRMPSRRKSCAKCDNIFNEKYLLEFKRLSQV